MTAPSAPKIDSAEAAELVLGQWRVVAELAGAATASGLVTSTACAHAPRVDGDIDLVVVERLRLEPAEKPRARLGKPDLAGRLKAFAERARGLADARHLNLPSVREISATADEVTVVSDFVEGEALSALEPASLPFVVRLRVLVDVLGALSALHGTGAGLFHGEVTPTNVIVGFDGSSRLVRTLRLPERAARDVVSARGYVAPELLLADPSADHRADLYAVGILLWEALSGTRLFPDATRDKILTRQLAGDLPIARIPADAPWAAPLASIAAKALAVDPEQRYASAAELAAAIRLVVQAKLAAPAQVAAVISTLAGDAILTRRTRLRGAAERMVAREVDLDPSDLVEVEAAVPPTPTPTPTQPVPDHELDRSPLPARAQSVLPRDPRRRGLAILAFVAATCVVLLGIAAVRGFTRDATEPSAAGPLPSVTAAAPAPTTTASAASAESVPGATTSTPATSARATPTATTTAATPPTARPKPARPRPPRSSYEPLGI